MSAERVADAMAAAARAAMAAASPKGDAPQAAARSIGKAVEDALHAALAPPPLTEAEGGAVFFVAAYFGV